MDATAALRYLSEAGNLGVGTGRLECYRVKGRLIECDDPDGEGTITITPEEFEEIFRHNGFHELTCEDHGL